MILYHFTSPLHVDGCKAEGIALGQVLIRTDPIALLSGFQWLTTNPNRSQEWCSPEHSTLPYDRTAFRITIKIPRRWRKNVFPWMQTGPTLCDRETFDLLNAYGDPENWRLFAGVVQPYWFTAVERMPAREWAA